MITLETIKNDIEAKYHDLKIKPLIPQNDRIIFKTKSIINKTETINFDFNKKLYHYGEFDSIPTPQFLEYAYRALLKRYPDGPGNNHYEKELFAGKSRKSILTKLAYSREAKAKGVKMVYSFLPALEILLNKISIFSSFTSAIFYNRTKKRILNEHLWANQIEAQTQIAALQNNINQLPNIIDELQRMFSDQVSWLNQESNDLRIDLVDRFNIVEKTQEEAEIQSIDIRKRIAEAEMNHQNLNHSFIEQSNILGAQTQKLIKQTEEIQKHSAGIEKYSKDINSLRNEYSIEDSFYSSFEAKFRGDESIIRERLQVYVDSIKTSIGSSKESRGLDIGCGRGEWLDIMNNQLNIPTIGVDINSIFATNPNFEIIQGDFFEVFNQFDPESFDVITSFHLIEHLPVSKLFEFIHKISELLKTGGLLILETPSPISVMTSATNYYLDLTHRKPVHPATLQFLLEYFSIEHLETKYLQPHPRFDQFKNGAGNDIISVIVSDLYGYQDYGMIGRK